MKYRAMLSYLYNRPLEGVRCILAARSIHRNVDLRCMQNNIECIIIERADSGAERPTPAVERTDTALSRNLAAHR
jgi:hypothetical protein